MTTTSCIYLLIITALIGLASTQDCPCTLLESTSIPGTQVWDCENKGLTLVPGECFEIQSKNITELNLDNNIIESILSIDLFQLTDLVNLYISYNELNFFDVSALVGLNDLEIFHMEYNPSVDIGYLALTGKSKLRELLLLGSGITQIPDLSDSPLLDRLDARSNQLSSLQELEFAEITATEFLLNLGGNFVTEVAASVLMPLPQAAIINLDSGVVVWAVDEFEHYDFLGKNFTINIDLENDIKLCGVDGDPIDATICTTSK